MVNVLRTPERRGPRGEIVLCVVKWSFLDNKCKDDHESRLLPALINVGFLYAGQISTKIPTWFLVFIIIYAHASI